jgi:hypothetical protein
VCHPITECRHHNFLANLALNPSKTCIHTDKDSPYSNFLGDSSVYSQIIDYTNQYNKTSPQPLAWYSYDVCSKAYFGLCEVPVTQYTCPNAPPAISTPPTAAGACMFTSSGFSCLFSHVEPHHNAHAGVLQLTLSGQHYAKPGIWGSS